MYYPPFVVVDDHGIKIITCTQYPCLRAGYHSLSTIRFDIGYRVRVIIYGRREQVVIPGFIIIAIAKLDAAQYSRIENGKTDPSVSTLERIAKALGVSLADLFASTDELKEINSYDKSIMERVALMEALTDDEKHSIYTMLDAFIGKRKLKDALSNVLQDVK